MTILVVPGVPRVRLRAVVARGPMGPEGPPGPARPDSGSGPAALVFTQATASASWIIPHGFGRLPSIAVFDATGAELIADTTATDTGANVVFATPTAGTAILT